MRAVSCCVLILAILAGSPAFATPGTFVGTLVQSPEQEDGDWLYVEGRTGFVRRVWSGEAKVVYGEDVPAGERRSDASRSLTPGTQVRVTATQDDQGEWRASRIEILRTSS